MAIPRVRISIALMAFSRLRPQSLGNYEGSDEIRLGDFVEAEIKSNSIEFMKILTMLAIRKT